MTSKQDLLNRLLVFRKDWPYADDRSKRMIERLAADTKRQLARLEQETIESVEDIERIMDI